MQDKGSFDVLFEASGNQRALVGAFDALRPRGIVVQMGLGGEMTLPINTLVAKEFELRANVLRNVGGWAEWCLTEDSEVSVRLREAGYRVTGFDGARASTVQILERLTDAGRR